jgi:hypothetical protein
MKFIVSLFLLLCSFNAHALYYCKCDTGAHASCSAGSDSNDGSTSTLARVTLPDSTALENAAAGTTHNLCAGGWWSGLTGWNIQNMNVTRTAPLTIQTYLPASGATGRATLESTSGSTSQWVHGGFNNPTDHGGYVFTNIRMTKAGTPSGQGFTPVGNARWITLDNVRLDNWANAVLLSVDQGLSDVVIKNSWFGPNSQNGIVGSTTDLLIYNNDFEENNNDGSALEHAIYNGGCTAQQRITIRGNRFRKNSQNAGTCTSGNITARGNVTGLLIEDNTIEVDDGNTNCYGISVLEGYGACSEHIDGLVIRGNTVVNVGSNSIATRLCTGCVIENNRIVRTVPTGGHNGISIDSPSDPADLAVSAAQNAIVRNNSIFLATGSGGAGVSVAAGSGHKVINNFVYVTSGASSTNCFAHTALSNFTAWDNNWCYELGSGQWSATHSNLAAAQAAGFDTNGGNTDPQLAATPTPSAPSMAVQSTSPLRSAGRNTDKAVRDVLWCQRDSTPDIGAHEYGGTPCLTSRAPVELR